jgi:hypothetical protein
MISAVAIALRRGTGQLQHGEQRHAGRPERADGSAPSGRVNHVL